MTAHAMRFDSTPAPSRQTGFTLLEVLIAVLVLSVGLLGLAGLQASSLRNNHSADLRSQATILGYGIADRMRANRTAALAGSYDVAYASTPSGSSIAGSDVSGWKTLLSSALPSGDGRITRTGNIVTISVRWTGAGGKASDRGTATTFSFSTRI